MSNVQTDGSKLDSLAAKSIAQQVDETIGPLFIGFIISAALFGVTCSQGFVYFKRHPQDSARLKSIVVALLLLETFQTALVTHAMFIYTISNHGNIGSLNDAVWSIVIQVIPSALIVALVQVVWIMRIRSLDQSHRRTRVAVSLLALVFIEMVMSISLTAKACISPRWGEVESRLWLEVACFILTASIDMLVTGLLCHHLQRTKNGLRETDGMIQTMIGYGLRAGLFSCMGSVALVLVLVNMQTSLAYIGVYLIDARLYGNSLLAMLNWRRSKPTHSKVSESEEIELTTVHSALYISSQATRLTIPELEYM